MSVDRWSCWEDGLNFKRYYILERTSASFNAKRGEKDAVPFQTDFKLPVYPSSSVPATLRTLISMTGSSISFLVCPFRFLKGRDILPGCLLNCLSSLEPVTHAPFRIFYADSPFPCCWVPLRACSHQVRKRHIFDTCFTCPETWTFMSVSAAARWLAQDLCCVNRPGISCWGTRVC